MRKNQYGREDVCARVMSPQFLSVAAASRPQQEKIIIMIGGDAGGRSSIDHDSRRWTPLDATAGRPRSESQLQHCQPLLGPALLRIAAATKGAG